MEMKTFEDVAVGVPRQLWDRAESAALDDSTTVSALVAEALARHLSLRARLRTVEAWTLRGGVADLEELAEVDRVFDAAGCA